MRKKPIQRPATSVFSLFLMEDKDGNVTIRSDYVGQGENSFDIGMDILHGLKLLESMNKSAVRVEDCFLSSYHQ